MAVGTDISCYVNESLVLPDTITADGTPHGTPVNITGWAIECVIHQTVGDGQALKTYTTANGGIAITNGPLGQLTVIILNADVVSLGVGDFAYYIARTDSGQEANLTSGGFSILPI